MAHEGTTKVSHSCAFCDAIKVRHWRGSVLVDEFIWDDCEDCDHEWEDGEYL